MSMATYSATVIVDPPHLGGDVTLIINGRTFIVRGALKRGLKSLAKEAADA